MRQWTQQKKLLVSEAARKEAENAIRMEINAENPSAEPHTGSFLIEQLARVKSRESEIFDKVLNDAYDNVFKKANFLIKLALPRQFQEIKKQENMTAVKTGLASRLSGLMKQKSTVGGVARRTSLIVGPGGLGLGHTNSVT